MVVEAVLVHAREDVRRERRCPRAGSAQRGLDRLRELGHRHAGPDGRRDLVHRPLDRAAGAAHRVELLRALDPTEGVHERRPGAKAVAAEDPPELEGGLRPHPVADSDRSRSATEALRNPLEDGSPVVGLVHDHDLAVGAHGQVEDDDHAREDVDRIRVGAEEAARHPAVGIRALPEERDAAFDAGQVLEVARESEKEEIDTLFAHALGQTAPPLRVVEH